MIEVLAEGPLATVQDLGRVGLAALGVPRSGAFDRAALQAANRLVGNPPDAAAIEITFGGLQVRMRQAVTIALTGAPCPGTADWYAPITLAAGTIVRLGTPRSGARSYMAVRGGIAVPAVLGSRSTDLLGGLGPAPLAAGDRLPIGTATDLPSSTPGAPAALGSAVFRLVWGPREEWLSADGRRALLATSWTVRPDSDRIGVRFDGPPLERARTGELASEPTLPGAVQLPPDGRPILFGPDAPVTGGYPVVAVVDDPADLDRAAQLRPGDTVRFAG
jgi:biotin-dependent carboxylase-like uncharacterized protein